MWGHPAGLCLVHAGFGHRGPQRWRQALPTRVHARYAPCACSAYGWPHRPAGGACHWPEGFILVAVERLTSRPQPTSLAVAPNLDAVPPTFQASGPQSAASDEPARPNPAFPDTA